MSRIDMIFSSGWTYILKKFSDQMESSAVLYHANGKLAYKLGQPRHSL